MPTVVAVALLFAVILLEIAPEIPHEHSFDASAEVGNELSVDGSILYLANDCVCSLLSIQKVLVNRKMEHHYNSPNLNDSHANDTNDHSMDATTSHPRRTDLYLDQVQHIHLYPAIL